jgi:hypothetical protein
MLSYETRQQMIKDEIAKFPPTFHNPAFPSGVFRINQYNSYINNDGKIILYIDVRCCPEGHNHEAAPDKCAWRAFAKGTPDEIRANSIW